MFTRQHEVSRTVLMAAALAIVALFVPTSASAAPYSPSISSSSSCTTDAESDSCEVETTANADIECNTWKVVIPGLGSATRPGGNSATASFIGPNESRTYTITWTCTYGDPVESVSTTSSENCLEEAVGGDSRDNDDSDESADNDDSDESDNDDSDNDDSDAVWMSLPDAGGPRAELLWSGLALIAAGTGVVLLVRRRRPTA